MSKKIILKKLSTKYYSLGIILLLIFVFNFIITGSAQAAVKQINLGPLVTDTSKIIMGIAGSQVGIGTDPGGTYKLNVNGDTNITGILNVTGSITGALNLTGALSSGNVSAGTFGSNTGGGNYTFPSDLTGSEIYTNSWFRDYARTGLYNQTFGTHFYTSSAAYWRMSSNNGLQLNESATFDSAVAGYLYHDGSGFGLLSPDGNWRVRTINGNQELYGNTLFPGSGIWNSSGNVGIGTTNPLSKLQVAGTGKLNWTDGGVDQQMGATLTVGTKNSTGGSLFVYTAGQDTNFGAGFGVDGDNFGSLNSVINLKAFGIKYAGYYSQMAFHTSNGTSLYERMRIDANGNVGIGTTGPGAKLHLSGGQSATSIKGSYDATVFPDYSYTITQTGAADETSGTRGLVINANLGQSVATYGIGFAIANSNKMFIRYDGNVGIGTVSPVGKLQVAGQVNIGDASYNYTALNISPNATNGRYAIQFRSAASGNYGGNNSLYLGQNTDNSFFIHHDGIGDMITISRTGTVTANAFSGAFSGSLNAANVSSGTFGSNTGGGDYHFPGNIYTDSNFGKGLVGVYTSDRYQGVFAMGDAYKLAPDGSNTGNLYGLAWSHPNAGGVASNLNTHGLLVMENGTFLAAISGSIRARDDMRAPLFYDSNNTNYFVNPDGNSVINTISANTFTGNLVGNASTADKVNGYGSAIDVHVGTGMRPFYNWGGSNCAGSAPSAGCYTNGISVGSAPNDQAYGFEIAQNMWDDNMWTKTYNSGYGTWRLLLNNINFNSYSPTLTGGGASGTWPISITGNAGSATSVLGLTLTSSANGINPDSVSQNQIGYNTSVSLFGQSDGGLYSSAYSSSWIHQIYGDFRTGQIAVRGKSNGTWQAWRAVIDSGNIGVQSINAAYVSSGNFGANTGGGSYTFPGTVTAPIFAVNGGSQFMASAQTQNMKLKGGGGTDVGLTGYNSSDTWVWQLYGAGSTYGFLNGNWSGWDMMKTIGGSLVLNGSQTVIHSGNIGSQSVSYATSAGSATSLPISGYGNASLTFYQTPSSFDGSPADWASYIIASHGDGASYYHQSLRLPFWGVPQYRRQMGSVSSVTSWYNFVTDENIASYLSGTSGYLPKFNGASSIISSLVYDNGTGIGIGTNNPTTGKIVINPAGFTYAIDAGGGRIGNVSSSLDTDAANVAYVKTSTLNTINTAGTSTASVNLNMNGKDIRAVNKLTVLTIDPLYNIGGTNYSTFASAIAGGVKEEFVGKAKIVAKNKTGEYENIIDFDQQAVGSDLWVWHKTVDFSDENVQVLLTPSGRAAQVYYLISNNQLILRSDKPVTVSYRLIGRRVDWQQWPTKATDQTEKASIVIK